jgi:nitrite reductase/ring-hydroxylating ferredoxin subunit
VTQPTWLPAASYAKGEPFMLEKAAIFARDWLPMSALSQLEKRGDYVSATIGGWPVFAVRDDSVVRVFRNTCRHQNMMIVERPAGQCEVLQCRYHGWQYALDGKFVGAPPLVAPADPAAAGNHLVPLTSAIVQGLVFCNLRDDAPPYGSGLLAEGGGPANERHFRHVRTTDVACNWKTYVEQRLADGWRFEWPLLVIHADGDIAEQIVPRSFVRTRIVSLAIANSPSDTARAAEVAIGETAPRVEMLQQRYEGGTTDLVDLDRAHAFRARVQAATPS